MPTSENAGKAKFAEILFLGTWVNKGKKKGRGCSRPRPSSSTS